MASNQPAKDATTSEPRNGSSMPLLLQHLMQSAQNEKSPQVGEAPKKNVMDVENVEKMLQERHADPRREQDDVAKEKEKVSEIYKSKSRLYIFDRLHLPRKFLRLFSQRRSSKKCTTKETFR